MSHISTTRAVERCERLEKLGPPPPWRHCRKLQRWLREYNAIMALDISVHAEMLRTLYTPSVVAEMANRKNPIGSLIGAVSGIAKSPKGDYLGRKWVEPVEYKP